MGRRRAVKTSSDSKLALSSREHSKIVDRLATIRENTINAICPNDYTIDDFYALFVPKHLVESIRVVQENCEVSIPYWDRHRTVEWDPVGTVLCGLEGDVVCTKQQFKLQEDAPCELINRITAKLIDRLQLVTEFDRCLAVLDKLNEICDTPAQIRFFWPQIVPLAEAEELTKLVERAHESPRTVPGLPIGLREACKKASATFAMAQLLMTNQSRDTKTSFSLSIGSRKINENGFEFVAGG